MGGVPVTRRILAVLLSVGFLATLAGYAVAGALASNAPAADLSQAGDAGFDRASVPPTTRPTATPTRNAAFPSIDLGPTASPSLPYLPNATGTAAADWRRPPVAQDADWLERKAAGLVTLVDGHIGRFDASADPMTLNGAPLPEVSTLDTSWSRWIIEPYGYGVDAKGQTYSNESYWDLCGPGAATVALYYWQRLTGIPDVTGMSGSFLDPYVAEGVDWPTPGPHVPTSSTGKRVGTYWTGADKVNGFEAHGRGFMMYLAMAAQPDGWTSTGIAAFSEPRSNKAAYPLWGTSRVNMQDGVNWEIAGHGEGWANAWYASVDKSDPSLAQDLRTAVMLDVGRDGVPVLVALDTANLPNWQTKTGETHVRHSIAIVGYDNASNPPTYTYLDTCGRLCNPRGNNQNGRVHVIPQSKMVAAIDDAVGSGFVW